MGNIWENNRSSHQMRSMKKVFLKIAQNLQEKTCARFSFLCLQLYQKRDSNAGVFMWDFQIFKNTFFKEHLRATASKISNMTGCHQFSRFPFPDQKKSLYKRKQILKCNLHFISILRNESFYLTKMYSVQKGGTLRLQRKYSSATPVHIT